MPFCACIFSKRILVRARKHGRGHWGLSRVRRTIVPRPNRLRGNRVDSCRERYEVNVRLHPRQQIAQLAESLAVRSSANTSILMAPHFH